MYNLLVVDDERIERTSIKILLSKFQIPVCVYEAGNGKEALKILNKHRIHIMITDIRMPIMDGLALSLAAAEAFPDVKIIIYSGYADFEYARQAIRAGVVQYLLKPIQVEEFKQTMEDIIHECEKATSEQEDQLQLAHMTQAAKDFQRQRMMHALTKPADDSALYQQAVAWITGSPVLFPMYLLLVRSRTNFIAANEAALRKIYDPILTMPHDYLNLTDHESLYFIYPGRELADYQMVDIGEQLLQKTVRIYGEDLFLIISCKIDSVAAIESEFRMLDEMVDYTFFMQEGCVLLSRDGYLSRRNTAQLDQSLLDCIYEDALYRDYGKLKKDLAVLIKSMQNVAGLSHLYVKSIFLNIFSKLQDNSPSPLAGELHTIMKEIVQSNRMDALVAYIFLQLDRMEEMISVIDDDANPAQTAVRQTLKYIHQEYANASLNLDYLAERVYLSPNYLSSLFKKETGISVSRYISKHRLTKAEELLLTTNIKVLNIGTAVGFSSDSYFVTVFGNQYGMPPSKYRETHLQGEKGRTRHDT